MKKIIGSATVLSALFLLSGCSLYGNSNQSNSTAAPSSSSSQNQQSSTSAVNAVIIQNFAFSPAALTIKKGATVTWINNDSTPHQIKSATFNSDQLSKGQTFSFTLDTAGTFDYFCAIHPSMLGKIIVE